MTGFFGAVGDWRYRPSEFAFDDAVACIRGAAGEAAFSRIAEAGASGGKSGGKNDVKNGGGKNGGGKNDGAEPSSKPSPNTND